MTRRYGKPVFGLDAIDVDGVEREVLEEIVWSRPFCNLLHFVRPDFPGRLDQPKLLIVAPMSGHYATLLRGTVEAFLPTHRVYVTDWTDARMAPLALGGFDLDDYIDYLRAMLEHLGPGVHTLGVCQPAVPLIAAVALMEAADQPDVPASMTLMGGPIDTRRSPTAVNQLAEQRGVEWFRANCLQSVPFPYPGFGRQVYPGYLQLSGFMAMNFDRHVNAHLEMFNQLVSGDGDFGREAPRVLRRISRGDGPGPPSIYMQTIETVFVRHLLPKGEMTHRGAPVDLKAIRRCGADDGRRRERRHLRRRPDAGGAGPVRQHSRGEEAASSAVRTSATTACSTARAFAPRSRRASPPSMPTSTRSPGQGAGKRRRAKVRG